MIHRGARIALVCGLVSVLMTLMVACGGSSAPPPPPVTYTITVMAASGTAVHDTNVSLTVH